MVRSDGYVKVLDFGLAKRMPASGAVPDRSTVTDLSVPGQILGTVAYMSPEQIQGKEIDQRSDLFAFGIVLYEMLTGEHPWPRKSTVDTLHAILHDDPPPMQAASALLAQLIPIVQKLLPKNPAERYPFAEAVLDALANARIELAEALHAPKVGRPLAPDRSIRSLAVLPFANASGDPQMEYLSDGLTESIIFGLSQLSQLRIMSRSTVFRYKGRSEEAQETGQTLGVETVLTGKVLQRGESLLVSAELVDVENGWQRWGAQYRRKVGDIFATEQDIAKEISEKLRLAFTPEKQNLLAKRHPENVEAYHLYLKGRFYWGKRTEEALYKGIQYFRQAIEKDPTYALAYAGLAESYVPLAVYCHLPPKDACRRLRLRPNGL